MSAADTIQELPRLTEAERRAVRQVLLDLANQDDDVRSGNQAVLDGAMLLDRMEDQNARRDAR